MRFIGLLLFMSLSFCLQSQIQLNNDEFDNPASLVNWININEVEGWSITQLENYNIGDTIDGNLFMMPLSVSWYEEYRGPLLFKEMAGDFVVTISVTASARDGINLPATDFSLAGIMIRTPMDYPNHNPAIDWSPNEQNYIFMSIGRANQNRYSFEIKNTCDSRSCLNIVNADTNSALIRMIRRGDEIVVMSKFGDDSWTIQNRYNRTGPMDGTNGSCGSDCDVPFPDTVQIGFVAYTDWPKVSSLAEMFHNSHTIHPDSLGGDNPTPEVPFNPDLRATFDYIRFDSLNIPNEWVNSDLANAFEISDAQLISQYGYNWELGCPDSISITKYPISDRFISVRADSLISSSSIIPSTKDIYFKCGNEILLNSGFEVSAGTTFTADQDGCQN